MRKNVFFSFALLFLLFISSQSLFAQTDTLYGRVTDTNGNGISSVTVTIYESGNSPYCPNSTITAITSPFGYYSAQIDYYCSAIIIPSAKQYTFTPSYRFIDFQTGDYSNVNFVGEHQ
jgi:hypothetical protein